MATRPSALVTFITLLALAAPATFADPRPFTFNTDTYPMGKGDWEYEQWVTWRTSKEDESDYQYIEFRHEFEFGLAENFDLAVYLPTWHYEDSEEASGTRFDHIDVEGIVYLSNPVTDPIGFGIYNEVKVGEDVLEYETKLLFQKDVGNWVFVYNLILETELEGVFGEEENEVEGELAHTVGVSCAVARGWFLGAEAIVESEYEDWSEYEGTTAYAGPAVSFQGNDRFWFTVTPTYQLTDNEDEADFQVRLIAALQF